MVQNLVEGFLKSLEADIATKWGGDQTWNVQQAHMNRMVMSSLTFGHIGRIIYTRWTKGRYSVLIMFSLLGVQIVRHQHCIIPRTCT